MLYGVDAHSLKSFKNVKENIGKASKIADLVSDKIIKENYNPIIAREKNEKLQVVLNNGQRTRVSHN